MNKDYNNARELYARFHQVNVEVKAKQEAADDYNCGIFSGHGIVHTLFGKTNKPLPQEKVNMTILLYLRYAWCCLIQLVWTNCKDVIIEEPYGHEHLLRNPQLKEIYMIQSQYTWSTLQKRINGDAMNIIEPFLKEQNLFERKRLFRKPDNQ